MDLAALRTATLTRCGLDSSDPIATSGVLTSLVNSALHSIEVDHDWPWLQASTTTNTVSGTGTIAVPAGWMRTVELADDIGNVLERYSMTELDDRWPPTGSQGKPYEYAIYADTIVLRPVPDAVYVITHRYIKVEPDLVADADTPLMPASFHSIIAELATWLVLRRDREDPRADVAYKAYLDWRQKMVDNRRRASGPGRIRVRP